MTSSQTPMRRADRLRRHDSDNAPWWTGYIRGLRRAHHGDNFGDDAEHALYLSAADSDDPQRAALGRGYRAGLTMTAQEPE
mgnify:FL=1